MNLSMNKTLLSSLYNSNAFLLVVVVPFAGFDIYGTLHVVTRRDILKSLIKYLENYLRICNEQVKKHGPLAGKLTVIYDMEGFNLKQYLWRPGKAFR